MKQKIHIGFSPCPNDTFIFDALVNHKIDSENLEFVPVLEDVQTLNQWALEGRLDVTKISYAVLPLLLPHYTLLNSGSALGNGVGPLLISKDKIDNDDIKHKIIAIPGEHTTAHLLFSMAYPDVKNKVFIRYDQIEEYVLSVNGPGVIIHENRFTYQDKGLIKITDLGDYWEEQTGTAIPLGGIMGKSEINKKTQQQIDRLIRKSVEYSFEQYPKLSEYIKQNAQEMSEEVMRSHIDLYVNDFTKQLGDIGRNAVLRLMQQYNKIWPAVSFMEQLVFVSEPEI